MRSSRRFACYLMSGLSVLPGISQSQAQMTQTNGVKSAQQAYYQPLTDEQYQQHAQAAYVSRAPPQSGLQNRESPMTIRERAAALLRAQQAAPSRDTGARFDQRPSPFPQRGSNIGYSRLRQESPFGPPQTKDTFGKERLTDVFGKTQVPDPNKSPQDKLADPFADPPIDDKPKESQAEKAVPTPADATAKQDEEPKPGAIPFPPDPPGQEPPMRDPVLPPDAEFTPDPGPGTEPPKMNDVPKPVVPPQGNGDDQPGTVKPPNEIPLPQIDPTPETDPQENRSTIKDDVYKAPSPDRFPPIVHPDQVIPYPLPHDIMPPQLAQPQFAQPQLAPFQTAPPQMMPTEAPSYSPMGQPYYQPAYQPIPGVPAPPGFYSEAVPPCCSPMVVDGPPDFSGGVVVPQDSVYSNVVGDCSTCQTSGQACCSGCPNFYFSFFGGYTSLRDMEGQSNGGIIQADSGSGFGFALGRRNSRNLRTELELSFRENDLTGILFGNTSQPFSGELKSFSGMANAYWEFVDVRTCCLKPYFGAGIGFVSIDSSATDSFGQSLIVPGAENDSSFAFQWMAGINYKAYRNMDLFAEYRFFQATTFRVDSTVAGVSDRYEFETDNVFVGFRWKF